MRRVVVDMQNALFADAIATAKVRRAKKDGLIDNFLYGSVSATYLSAVVDTL